jgi:hypothetical protein
VGREAEIGRPAGMGGDFYRHADGWSVTHQALGSPTAQLQPLTGIGRGAQGSNDCGACVDGDQLGVIPGPPVTKPILSANSV